ncbi:hypothetical protein Dsin_006376 [Dipteronia sinensis]|uniref:Senescence regulator n=1 Tax=Dipteronia sinensis TaxID=43782 RepID=A0AAE0AZN0_9ROSI|nr:hypothetical protein Dsin_006376 [Dipteronia sinensis]
MASRKIFPANPNYIYPTPGGSIASDALFEFDDADMWRSSDQSATMESNNNNKKTIPSSRSSKRLSKKSFDLGGDHHHNLHRIPVASASLPVNIPDWSKILKEEYTEHSKRESDDDGDENNVDDDDLVPPHEYLAMRRGASFSVHEGIGRTLKGRDLRRVRNAIWQKVGFED